MAVKYTALNGGGGSQLYRHRISFYVIDARPTYYSFQFISSIATPITKENAYELSQQLSSVICTTYFTKGTTWRGVLLNGKILQGYSTSYGDNQPAKLEYCVLDFANGALTYTVNTLNLQTGTYTDTVTPL